MKTKIIRQEVIFNALPDEVYNLLMNEDLHSTFTGSETVISNTEGKSFSAYDGYITGKNVELIPGEKIVQEWRAEEEGWPEDHFSKVVFTFARYGKGKTKMIFEQTGVPAHKAAAIDKGWQEYYWQPMKELLLHMKD